MVRFHWKIKSRLQKIFSFMPYGREIYYLGQRYGGRLKHFNIENRLCNAIYFEERLQKKGIAFQGKEMVEIGTGWAPILPLFFWLCGAKRIDTFDIVRWLQPDLALESVRQLYELTASKNGLLSLSKRRLMSDDRQEMLLRLATSRANWKEISDKCNIHYHAPFDTGKLQLSDASKDIVFSNLVLELIPLQEINRIFKEAFRILRPGGVMIHLIDLGDQFASADDSITSINFLQYTSEEFAKFNSPICYQNRLRAPTYHQVTIDHGFEIVDWDTKMDKDAFERLPSLKIVGEFERFTSDELCTTSVFVLARKPIYEI